MLAPLFEETRRLSDSYTHFYGKRLKINQNQDFFPKNSPSSTKLPIQGKENVKVIELDNDDDDVNESNYRNIDIVRQNTNKSNLVRHSHDKNYKFFKTHRTPLSSSKIIRAKMSYKDQLKKRINFLQESYRLSEKFKYIQLLQSQTSCYLLKRKSSFNNDNNALPTSKIPLIDLTNDDHNVDKKTFMRSSSISEIKLDEKNVNTPGEKDLEIIEEITDLKHFKKGNKSESKKPSDNFKNLEIFLEDSEDDNEPILVLDEKNKPYIESLEAKLCELMQIHDSEISKDGNKDKYVTPVLTPEQEKKIQNALIKEPSQEVLVKGFNLSITRKDMQTLKGLNWLNDEIINFYMNLIMERSKKNTKLPKVYVFNTFFFTKLVSSGYASLKRWTKQVNIFSYDILFIPIHLGMHWCMSTIDFRYKTIKYYDSVGSPNDLCLEYLLLYLENESLNKNNLKLDSKEWSRTNVKNIPQQMNGSDCGVFSCMFAEHIARNSPITFTQDHMPFFRKKMILEILDKDLMT
ncbi:sentrin/sumo-specific protease, putative [Pediculus humanus corporis]|uniref:Sentrin/sumo-specific protease, putative n=1 Tax=Pediculus humanus subsp. corporis TaxID=121224 RepID=E0W3V3_PEDHC|nr:sentrin/sumo-specific protease, putative [Pediculus humanus corporis]EEB20309.1 sentrin/sumo-specific protease, putative [Pediculus humanus corporis]